MEDPAPDLQASEARADDDQEQTPSFTDIVVFCHPRNVANLVQSFEEEIKHAAGALPAFVLWSGQSGLLHMGVVVLEWEGPMNPEFLHNLSIDHEIFDFVVYEWEQVNSKEEQAEKAQEGENEAEKRQLI